MPLLQLGSWTLVSSLAGALFIGGTPAIAGAAYLVVIGTLSWKTVLVVSILTTLVWDTIWYFVGRSMSLEKIRKHRFFLRNKDLYERILRFHGERQHIVHFFSRFIYGTASVFSVVSGVRRMNFFAYIMISAASIAVWFGFLLFLAEYLHRFIGVRDVKFALTIAIALLFGIVWVARYGLKRVFMHYTE